MLCSKLPYSENCPSPIRVLCYEGPLVRSSPSSKIAMFRRFYLPNFTRSIRIFCYEGSSWYLRGKKYHNIGTVYLFCYNESISEVFHWCSYDLDMSCYYNVYWPHNFTWGDHIGSKQTPCIQPKFHNFPFKDTKIEHVAAGNNIHAKPDIWD